jgi:hypothetical protein
MMADEIPPTRLKFSTMAEWEIELRRRAEEEAERDRSNPLFIRIREQIDALNEEARLAQIEIEEEAKRERIEIEEEAKRKWYEDVRLAVAAVIKEEAKLVDEADRKAKEAAAERLVPHIKLACAAAGRKLSISDQCVDDIRPHLPKEEQGATFETIKAAIRRVRDRDKHAN